MPPSPGMNGLPCRRNAPRGCTQLVMNSRHGSDPALQGCNPSDTSDTRAYAAQPRAYPSNRDRERANYAQSRLTIVYDSQCGCLIMGTQQGLAKKVTAIRQGWSAIIGTRCLIQRACLARALTASMHAQLRSCQLLNQNQHAITESLSNSL